MAHIISGIDGVYESTNPVFTNICYDFSNGENGEKKNILYL